MQLRQIAELLRARVLSSEHMLDTEVQNAFCCDMMSDVLAFASNQSVLLTGLLNPQVVRTAMMMDMHCIVFVNGKEVHFNSPKDAIAHKIGMVTEDRRDGDGGLHVPGSGYAVRHGPAQHRRGIRRWRR